MTDETESAQLELTLIEGWEQLPEGWTHDDVADVAVDENDDVYVLARWTARVLHYDAAGRFLASWGEDVLSDRPHGLTLAPDGTLYCVDELDHVVRQFSKQGELLRTIGMPGTRSDTGHDPGPADLYVRIASIERGAGPFNRPTSVAVTEDGELYVADGYGNCRVHRFDPGGQLLGSWGEPGTGPGEFHLPHAIVSLDDGRLVVADRENERLQVFDPQGRFLEFWTATRRPSALAIDRDGRILVGELARSPGERSWIHGEATTFLPARISVFEPNGTLVERLTSPPLGEPGSFVAPHGMATDSQGGLYLGEVSATYCGMKDIPTTGLHTLSKWQLPGQA